MIKLLKKLKKINFFYPALFIGLVLFIFIFRGSVKIGKTEEGFYINAIGWAWNENVGWASFNCSNDDSCASVDYGVKLFTESMNFGGEAWSENVGWISFSSALSGSNTPDGRAFENNCLDNGYWCSFNDCISCYNPDDNKIYGWAKVLSLGDDGWISLNCANDNSCIASNYGSYLDYDGEFNNWGWSGGSDSTGLGWLSFNCTSDDSCAVSDYQVKLYPIYFPRVVDLTAPNWSASTACASGAKGAFLRWGIYDEDPGADQSSYHLIVRDSSLNTIINTGKVSSRSEQYAVNSNDLDYDASYYWQVKVWDDLGLPSDWVEFDTTINTASSTHVLTHNQAENFNSKTFTVYKHEFPSVNFTFVPDELVAGEVATFTDVSYFYTDSAPSTPVSCTDIDCVYLWIAQGAREINPLDQAITEIIFEYSIVTTTGITLEITDADNYTCSTSSSLFADLLPIWKEIKPEPY